LGALAVRRSVRNTVCKLAPDWIDMLGDILNMLSAFWVVFSFAFVVALTGAMSPGPLLTYTIIRTAKTPRRGYLVGLWVIVGHAILESVIIVVLLLGFSFLLENIFVVRTIAVVGGLVLVLFGGSIIRNVIRGTVPTEFLERSSSGPPKRESPNGTLPEKPPESDRTPGKSFDNPILGGIVVSMSNPYWWIWWASIGSAFMIQFKISFTEWPKLIAFFLGHEAGDLIWYLLVSVLAYFGLKRLNKKVYYVILAFCAAFMILFGLYLGISPFINNPLS